MTNIYFKKEEAELIHQIKEVEKLSNQIENIYENVKEMFVNVVNDHEGEKESSERGIALDDLYLKVHNAVNLIQNFHSAKDVFYEKLEKTFIPNIIK